MVKRKFPKKLLISYCGICCSLCPVYRLEDKSIKCPGCEKLIDCKIVQCARKKKIRYCFLCNGFPCKLYTKGFDWATEVFGLIKKWKPYSEQYIKMFKIAKNKLKNKKVP
jgi:hypothetical protein